MAKKKPISGGLSSSGEKEEEISESLATAMGLLTIGVSSSGKRKKAISASLGTAIGLSSSMRKRKKKKKKAISESLATAMGFLTIGLSSSGKEEEAISRCLRPSLPKEDEKTVYLGVNGRGYNLQEVTDLYIIKLSTKKRNNTRRRVEKPFRIEPIVLKLPLSLGSCSVAVGSTIYCTSTAGAAADNDSSVVVALDTTKLTANLKFTDMNIKRDGRFSEAVTDGDGKIYVFGGLRRYSSS